MRSCHEGGIGLHGGGLTTRDFLAPLHHRQLKGRVRPCKKGGQRR